MPNELPDMVSTVIINMPLLLCLVMKIANNPYS
jgi:hypothetical protein